MNKTDDEIAKRIMELDQICIDYKFWDNSEYQAEFHKLREEQKKRHREKTKLNELQVKQPVRCLEATDWKTYIEQSIKTGLESPTPYKVIPYKNGIGIKKIEFIKSDENIDPFADIGMGFKNLGKPLKE